MSDYEVREKRSRSRKKNMMDKALRDRTDHKGAFSLKLIDPRKSEYRRRRININEVLNESEED